MDDRRIFVDPTHGIRQRKTFAILVIVGLVVVGAVWFFQLRTMLNREVVVDELQDNVAQFRSEVEASWATNAAAQPENSGLRAATDAMSAALQQEMIEQQVQDVVAQELADSLAEEGEQDIDPMSDAAAEDTTEATPPTAPATLPISDTASE